VTEPVRSAIGRNRLAVEHSKSRCPILGPVAIEAHNSVSVNRMR
jgi:hypothetical protein